MDKDIETLVKECLENMSKDEIQTLKDAQLKENMNAMGLVPGVGGTTFTLTTTGPTGIGGPTGFKGATGPIGNPGLSGIVYSPMFKINNQVLNILIKHTELFKIEKSALSQIQSLMLIESTRELAIKVFMNEFKEILNSLYIKYEKPNKLFIKSSIQPLFSEQLFHTFDLSSNTNNGMIIIDNLFPDYYSRCNMEGKYIYKLYDFFYENYKQPVN